MQRVAGDGEEGLVDAEGARVLLGPVGLRVPVAVVVAVPAVLDHDEQVDDSLAVARLDHGRQLVR